MKLIASALFLLCSQQLVASQWTQIGSDIDGLFPSDWAAGTEKGIAMNAAGTTIAVGSSGHDSDSGASNVGHTRVFDLLSGNNWIQRGSDIDGENAGDNSGSTVVMSADGLVIGIGEPSSEAGNTDRFDKDYGQVRVFEWINGDWVQRGDAIVGDDKCDFASSNGGLAMSASGDTLVVGAASHDDGDDRNSGQVRVMDWDGVSWNQRGADILGVNAGDWFGEAVDVSASGNRIAVGAIFYDGDRESGEFGCVSCKGQVRVFDWNNDGRRWVQVGGDIDGDNDNDYHGSSVALSDDGTILAVGAPQTNAPVGHPRRGAVQVYRFEGNVWTKIGQRIEGEAEGDRSGSALSISSDGSTIAIGSSLNNGETELEGHVRVFDFIESVWIQRGEDIDGEFRYDYSGYSVAMSANGNTVASGARFTDDGGGFFAGHVRIFGWEDDDDDNVEDDEPDEPDLVCEDDPTFKKGKRKKNCQAFLRRNAARKCNRNHKGKKVFDFCQATCETVGLGPCA